jgi:hypothetical protein
MPGSNGGCGLYEHADTHQPKITAPCSCNLQTLELSGWALTTRASLKARFGWVVTCSVYMIIYMIVWYCMCFTWEFMRFYENQKALQWLSCFVLLGSVCVSFGKIATQTGMLRIHSNRSKRRGSFSLQMSKVRGLSSKGTAATTFGIQYIWYTMIYSMYV